LAARTPLRPQDYARLALPASPAMHPDGDRIAYIVARFAPDGLSRHDLVLLDLSLGRSAVLAEDVLPEQPAWSPDGDQLAFCRADAGGGALCLWRRGAGELRFRCVPGTPRAPAWAPGGRRIAFEALDPAPPEDTPRVVRHLRYNVNGLGFIGDRLWRVYTADLDEEGVRPLGDPAFHHFFPAFAPDGRLALVTTRRPNWDVEWVWDVYTVDLERDAWTRLTASDGVAMYPCWSPDGRRVAFLHNHSAETGTTSDYHVMEAPADGSAPARCLGHALDRGAAEVYEPPLVGGAPPVYAAGGDAVLWLTLDRGRRVLQETPCDGGPSRRVAADVGWPSPSRDGRWAAVLAYAPDRPPELGRLDLATGRAELLSDLNPWLRQRVGAIPERIALGGPSAGAEAVVWRAPGASGPAPLVVQFHGGPHGAFGEYWNFAEQLLAGRGYTVASLNYRGSAGYGQAFADLVHADWGPKEGVDGLALVEELSARGWADPGAVGVYGISYGGFMTNWMITHYPERVHAAVTISTVASVFTSAYGIDHWESIRTDMGGPPWEIPGYYHDHSPASHLDRVTAPLLVLHGEQDMTCPLIEAEIMFCGLRWQGREVEFVRYPGESHSFLRTGRLQTIIDAHERLLGWFDRHLRGEAAAHGEP